MDEQETKGGVFVYGGTPSRFYEWEFRTSIRLKSCKDEDKPKTMSKIVESLRGEAALVAMDVGLTELIAVDGFDKLLARMRTHVFPQARVEAKELYRIGHKVQGALSRQHGESMMNYIGRRRRWWTMLSGMDNTIALSTTIRGDLMLEASGLTATEQLMILTSIGNVRDFEKLAVAMMEQHPKAHLGEKKSQPSEGKNRDYPKGKGRYRKFGHLAGEEQEVDDDEEDEAEEEEAEEDEGEEDTIEDVELDGFTCMICQGAEESDMASLIQIETTAYQAWGKFGKGKGKGKGKKGNGRSSHQVSSRNSL